MTNNSLISEACNTFALSVVSVNYGYLSLLGNRMAGYSNSIGSGISSTAGYTGALNQGF